MEVTQLFGRQVLQETLVVSEPYQTKLESRPALKLVGRWVHCQRCNQRAKAQTVKLPDGRYYCPHCFQLGRVTAKQQLWHLPDPNRFPEVAKPALTWQGQLTRHQDACSQQILHHFQAHSDHLLWAVTGAGKTEMLFKGIQWAVEAGLRVAIASPRIDVCLELVPRIREAFQEVEQIVLYGDAPEPYRYCQLTICTTHQLLRFYHAFDVLIVDEVDAFPFASDPGLLFAAQQAKKPTGAILYLTATPSRQLLRQVKRGQLQLSYLPLRYHGHPLPVINVTRSKNWRQQMAKQQLPSQLRRLMKQRLDSQRQFLLFVPHIRDLALVAAAINHAFPKIPVTTVYAADPERHEKVQAMRSRECLFLVTTTILERGVTFPDIDVFVLGADDPVFSTAALVQIAGRAGRRADAPDGLVQFFCQNETAAVRLAQRQIKLVNRKGQLLKREDG